MNQNRPPTDKQEASDRFDASRPDAKRPRNTQQIGKPFSSDGITTVRHGDDGGVQRHEVGGEIKVQFTRPWYHWPLGFILKVFAGVVVGLILIWLGAQPEVQDFMAAVRPWIENTWQKLYPRS